MINLKFNFSASSKAVFSVFKSKSGQRRVVLKNLKPKITSRSVLYIKRRKILEGLSKETYNEEESEALEHCYDSSTIALATIKENLIKNIKLQNDFLLTVCPYCLIREPNTWDHYLPKAKFPEYSVFAPNLIWVCGVCNTRKSDDFVEVEKKVVHTYFDSLPQAESLSCKIVIDRNDVPIVTFTIENPENSVKVDLLARHFEVFGLAKSYIKCASDYLSAFLQEFSNRNPDGVTEAQFTEELRFRYNQIPLKKGINYWEAALVKAMAQNKDLVRLINQIPSVQPDGWERR